MDLGVGGCVTRIPMAGLGGQADVPLRAGVEPARCGVWVGFVLGEQVRRDGSGREQGGPGWGVLWVFSRKDKAG